MPIYDVRSKLVHGEQFNFNQIATQAPVALRIGLDALRNLLDNHADKLNMSSSERVVALGFPLP